MSKKTIAIFTTAEGHLSIAEALIADLQHSYSVKLYFKRDDFFFDFYATFYKYFPAMLRIPFYVSKRKRFLKPMHQYFQKKYQVDIQKFVKKSKPDLCISTYFMYNSSIEAACETDQIPFINVLADPLSIHPLFLSKKAQFNAVFDAKQESVCQKIIKTKYVKTGWFIRPQFEEEYDTKLVRTELGLQTDVLTFLIVSGSEGSNFISTIFPTLLASSQKIQIIIACGNNKNLFKTVQVLSEMTEKFRDRIMLIPLAFTDQIHRYMQAADLVIGKAGPNTLFESIATQTPFFAITHIPGQEDGNLTIIKHYHVGYVQENPFKAGRLLKRIIENPDLLTEFIEPIKKLAKHNRQSKQIILDEIDGLIG